MVFVRVSGLEDARRQGVGREDDVRIRAAYALRQQVDEPRLVVPALDEREVGAAAEPSFQLLAVTRDRHRRVMRGQHQADDHLGARSDGGVRCLGDPRRPVLHTGEHGHITERTLQCRTRLRGDRVERRRVLDPEPAVPLDQVLHQLGRNGTAAADVGVVRRNVGQPLRRAVRHQHDRRAHTRASTVASWTSSVRRPRTAGSALGGTPCPRLNT